jgi:peptidoglycan/xylan/chitin deacetylase (PgdA/CDA1 family)
MKKFALQVLARVGVPSITRALTASMARVLMYHNFSAAGVRDPDALNVDGIRTQFQYLREHFQVVPLLELAQQLAHGEKLADSTVVLTIDDGRRNCYEFLFPLLKEFELPATFFVVSSFIRGEDWIWTDKVLWLKEQAGHPEELDNTRLASTFQSLNRMRPEARNQQIDAWAERAAVSIPQKAPPKYAPCSWSELQEMSDSGLLEVGSHTVSHPILSTISDEASWDELTRSRAQIEEGMGKKVACFCFPNGLPGDYREEQVRQVAEAGYACSVVAHSGFVRADSDRYRMPRIGVARKSSTEEFSRWLDGVMYYRKKLSSWFGPDGV